MKIDTSIKLIYVDLFCGAGGTSTGVEKASHDLAKCARVIACINHDKNAILSHAANHPDTLHFTEDIRTLDLTALIAHIALMRIMYPNALLVLWASLECTNFSKAKGGLPRDADSRTLAESLYRYIQAIDPDYIQIENVEEFMSWGPLDEKGKPISKLAGTDYIQWVESVKDYLYDYDYRVLNAANYGAYTSRKRFFGIFAKIGLPIVFPEPTHAKNPTNGLKKWKAVKDVLELADVGRSIFGRKKPLVEATDWRIHAGLVKFVAGGKEAWLLKYNSTSSKGIHNPPSIDEPSPVISCQNRLGIVSTDFISAYYGNGDNVSSIHLPAPTLSTKDRLAVVRPVYLLNYQYKSGATGLNEPCPTLLTKDKYALVKPQFIDQQFGNGKPATIEGPIGTITAVPKYNLVTPKWIMDTNFSNIGSGLNEPSNVITANRKWQYLVNPQYKNAGRGLNDPCFTLIARMDKAPPSIINVETETADLPEFIKISGNVVTYGIYESDSPAMVAIKEFMALYGIRDIKMRMLKIPELLQIMGFPVTYKLIGTKAEQKKYIGNAVETTMAKVMCEALVWKLVEMEIAA